MCSQYLTLRFIMLDEALMILKVKVLKTMRSRKGMSAITTKLARSRHVRDVGNVGLCLCILLREQYSEIGPFHCF